MNKKENSTVAIFSTIIIFSLSISMADFKPALISTRSKRELMNGPCCIIPLCTSNYQCFQTISCGHLCNKKEFFDKENQEIHTPGYKIRISYRKWDCRLEKCLELQYSCNDCPDPAINDFNIHAVTKMCNPCYYN